MADSTDEQRPLVASPVHDRSIVTRPETIVRGIREPAKEVLWELRGLFDTVDDLLGDVRVGVTEPIGCPFGVLGALPASIEPEFPLQPGVRYRSTSLVITFPSLDGFERFVA